MTAATIRCYLKLVRVRHWIKNVFVFAPLIFSRGFLHPPSVLRATLVFTAFCLVSSSVYILNDIVDRERDREHPRKRTRPLACGRIPLGGAVAAALLLLPFWTGFSAAVGPRALAVLIGYLALNVAYTLWLKKIVILDVMVIAFGFLLRVLAGAVSIGVPASAWMLLATLFLALFLGFGKRRREARLGTNGTPSRPVLEQYSVAFLDRLIVVSVSLTIMTYSLHTIDPRTVERLGTDNLIVTVPLVVFGLFRYLFLVYRRDQGEEPSEEILADTAIMVDAVLWGALSMGILLLSNAGARL